MNKELIERAGKVSTAIYVAVEKSIATDVSECIRDLIAEIQRQDRVIAQLANKRLFTCFKASNPEKRLRKELSARIGYARDNRSKG